MTNSDKQALRALFEMAARGGVQACALVAEGWRSGGTRAKLEWAIRHAADGRSLAELPDRQEILPATAAAAPSPV